MEGGFAAEDSTFRFIVGIDLGTTNSAVAYVDRTAPEPENRRIRFLDIPQLVSPGSVAHRNVLPSFLYLPGPYELPPGSTALPWDTERDYAVGEFAREQGALVPGRLVASAKSWLCHAGVDRTAPILPWGASPDVNKVSPVEASTRYLQHIREAWNQAMARGREGAALEAQLIILTVPASFDEIARELTLKAAHQAGLPRVVLLEEPLAAFYAWISGHVPAPLSAESGFSGQESGPSTVEENFAASPSPDPSHQIERLPENPPKSPFTKGGSGGFIQQESSRNSILRQPPRGVQGHVPHQFVQQRWGWSRDS